MKVYILTANDSIEGAFYNKETALLHALKKFGILTIEGEDNLLSGKSVITKDQNGYAIYLIIREYEMQS